MGIIKTIKGIIDGSMNYVFPKEEVEVVAKERLKICSTCPLMSRRSGIIGIGGMFCDNAKQSEFIINGEKKIVVGCGCDLITKTRSLEQMCPAEQWEKLNLEVTNVEKEKTFTVKDPDGSEFTITI